MDNQLATQRDEELALATRGTANFHQSIQLLHGLSDAVQLNKGKAGEYLFGDINLTSEVNICVCAQRFHSIYLKNKSRVMESFDATSDITKKIVATKRDYSAGEDPRYGYSFLIYLPEHAKFGVYHPNVPSARPVSKDIIDHWTPREKRSSEAAKALPHTNCFVLSSFLRQSRNPHFVPKVTPLEPDKTWFPGETEMNEALEIFSAPVNQERESPPPTEAKDTDDR